MSLNYFAFEDFWSALSFSLFLAYSPTVLTHPRHPRQQLLFAAHYCPEEFQDAPRKPVNDGYTCTETHQTLKEVTSLSDCASQAGTTDYFMVYHTVNNDVTLWKSDFTNSRPFNRDRKLPRRTSVQPISQEPKHPVLSRSFQRWRKATRNCHLQKTASHRRGQHVSSSYTILV